MPSVLITGGTGLVGTAVKALLEHKGYEVVLLTRSKTPIKGQAHWDINAGTIDSAAIAAADYIIHLAGAGVADKLSPQWSAICAAWACCIKRRVVPVCFCNGMPP